MAVFIPAHIRAAKARAEEDDVSGVIKLMQKHADDAHMCETSSRLVWNMILNSPENKKRADDFGILELMLTAVDDHGDHEDLGVTIKKNFLAIVQNIASLCRSDTKRIKTTHRVNIIEKLSRMHLYGPVLKIMKEYPDRTDIQECGCGAIGWLMVEADETVKSKCMQLGGLDLAEKAMFDFEDNPHVGRYARWTVDLLREAKARYEFDMEMKREAMERQKMIDKMVRASVGKYTQKKKKSTVDHYEGI